MNKDKLKKLYLDAESSLEEEASLFNSEEKLSDEMRSWAKFVNQQKTNAPENLAKELWSDDLFDEPKKAVFYKKWLPIAASIALITAFSFYLFSNKQQDYNSKKRLLEEAILMSSEEPKAEDILYQDQLLTIYITAE